MKIGVLLSGCGVYDGAEIQEVVFTLLAINEIGAEAICISIDRDQYHVVNHVSGEEMSEKRNMMVEAARITRGVIHDIQTIRPSDIDALVIPGGFGSAKNFTNWAFEGANSTILPEVKLLLVNLVNIGTPIVGLCVSPVVIAKALEGSNIQPTLTLGTNQDKSPYDILAFHEAVNKIGAKTQLRSINELEIDYENRIISAPCYMMDASISEIRQNIKMAIEALNEMLDKNK